MLYINPDTCIDCGACVPECPVEAIYDEGSLPDDQRQWLALNAERVRHLPVITRKREPLPSAAELARQRGFVLLDS
jgi:ferredoxin